MAKATFLKESVSELSSKIPKGVKRAGLYGFQPDRLFYGAKAAMHASVLKTSDPLYKSLRSEGLLSDKAHKKQLAYWRKRNA